MVSIANWGLICFAFFGGDPTAGLRLEVQYLNQEDTKQFFWPARTTIIASLEFDIERGRERSAQARFGDRTLSATAKIVGVDAAGFKIAVEVRSQLQKDREDLGLISNFFTTIQLRLGERLIVGGSRIVVQKREVVIPVCGKSFTLMLVKGRRP